MVREGMVGRGGVMVRGRIVVRGGIVVFGGVAVRGRAVDRRDADICNIYHFAGFVFKKFKIYLQCF